MPTIPSTTQIGRRAFLRNGSLLLAAASAPSGLLADDDSAREALRIGIITDLHYADKPPAGTRYYRETLAKLGEAAEQFARDKPAFVVELGDLIDAADSVEREQSYLKQINREFANVAKERHYVLGNHCVDMLHKQEFLDGVEQPQAHYSFDRGYTHFVVLDACFRSDGEPYGRKNSRWNDANIPQSQIEWLEADLKATTHKVVVFAHQRLDANTEYCPKNAAAVRTVFENSGKVLAVFQGHSHQNDYKEVGGIHYATLVAMVEGTGAENSGYSVADIRRDGTINLRGFRKQKDYVWKAPGA